MTQFEFSTLINRPVEEVFSLVDRPEDYPKWQTGVLAGGEASEGSTGVGSKGWQERKILGCRVKMGFEITEYEPNKIKGFKSVSDLPNQTESIFLRKIKVEPE